MKLDRPLLPVRGAGPRLAAVLLAGACVLGTGCSGSDPDVVLYCALDEVHSAPLVQEFERRTGLSVKAYYDVEAHKTVGLVNRIRGEAQSPRCDVFWNNEIAHTIQLGADGLLQPYESPSAKDIPAEFKHPDGLWTGFAARARVFIYNTEMVEPGEVQGMWDLVDERWGPKAGMAMPLTGTTLTHFTALHVALGEDEAGRYIAAIKDRGVSLTGGNMTLATKVGAGEIAFGWTDTDDYNVRWGKGEPVGVIYPDDGGIGTLLVPNTVCVLKDAPHPEAAKKLVDYILSEEVEANLAASRSAQIPVRAAVQGPENVKGLGEFTVMKVDYAAVAAELDRLHREFQETFVD